MIRQIIPIILLVCGFVSGSAAQQAACAMTDVAVGVTNGRGEPFRGLSPADFVSHGFKGQVSVKSLDFDNGPRRVALVVDRSKKLPRDAQQAAQELVREILATGRAQDSFALVVARAPGPVVKFGEDTSKIKDAVMEAGPQKGKGPGVMDAIMEAVSLFGERRQGDAVIVIAADLGGNHHSNPKTVAKALSEHGIRMFGLALGPVSRGNITVGGQGMTAWGLATVTPGIGSIPYSQGDEDFIPLATNSGGAVLPVINSDDHRSYDMSDPKLHQKLRQSAKVVFTMVASLYHLQVKRSKATHPEGWQLDVTERVHKAEPHVLVLYPHELGPC